MNWRVGMRCRLVRPRNPQNAGVTGTVIGIGPWCRGDEVRGPDGDHFRTYFDADCIVLWDDGDRFHCLATFDQLEPIQPEGRKVVSWSDCLWMPEHMRETA